MCQYRPLEFCQTDAFQEFGNVEVAKEQLMVSVNGPRITGRQSLRMRMLTLSRPGDLLEGIDDTICSTCVQYIRSDVNPADVLTRGVPPEEVKTWMEGPPFLQRPEEEWPKFKENSKSVDEESLKEIKSNNEKTTKWKEPTQCTVFSEESTNIRRPTDLFCNI
ncbi:uncharacterized protein [Montipora capricornis]|uniref:uncharacterized protein isoform X2 n=1 Tax=Montipora capricornis TaxID=246305 RepID=UPI0035F1A3B2